MKYLLISLCWIYLSYINVLAQWQAQVSGTTSTLWSIKAVNNDIVWAGGQDGIILNTSNGGLSWNLKSLTQNGYTNYGIAAIDLNTAWVIGTTVDTPYTVKIWMTTDGGATWNEQYFAVSTYSDNIHFFDNNNGVFLGDPNPLTSSEWNIQTTTNGGLTWNRVPSSNYPPANNGCGEFGLVHSYGAYGDNVWFSTYYIYCPNTFTKIYRSTNRGYNWTVFDLPYKGNELSYIAFSSPTNGIAISYSSSIFGIISQTTNGGNSWNILDTIDVAPYALRSSLTNQNFFLAVGDDGISSGESSYSNDYGNLWNQLGSTSQSLFDATLSGGYAWSVGPNGVIMKMDLSSFVPVELTSFTATVNGKEVLLNWSTTTELNNLGFEIQRSTGLKEFFTVGFVNGHGTTTDQQNYIFADRNLDNGTYYYRLKQVDYDGSYEYSDVVEVEWRAFNSYLLEQNFPNPFNPITTIGFGIQNKSNVKITILNAIGEEVAIVLNEEKEVGYHQVEFNATDLSSGIYFYRLQAGNFIETKKMILMK